MNTSKSHQFCCVPQCKTRKMKHTSLHYFPKSEYLCRLWAEALKLRKPVSKYMQVCNLHFREHDFHPTTPYRKKQCLKKNVVPCENIPTEALVEMEKRVESPVISKETFMEDVIEVYVRGDDVDTKVEPNTIKDLLEDFKTSPIWDEDCKEELSDSNDLLEALPKQRKRKINSTEEVSAKKKTYMQKYRKDWENNPMYKSWLSESVLGSLYFYCKFCKNNNKCGRTEIEKHMTCRKHIRNSKMPHHRVQVLDDKYEIYEMFFNESYLQKKFTFRGMLCSVFTPFKTNKYDINYSIILDYARFLQLHDIKGILINDKVGEGMSLTPAERMKLVEEWAKACEQTKQHLMVQVGGAPFKEVQEMVRHAERKKVGSILVLPDLYNKPKDHFDLMRYIKLVSDCANTIPLLYHHQPSYTGVNIDMTKFLSDIIGEIDSFVGVIFSDNNLNDALSTLQVNQDKFIVFIGTDEILLGALASGFNSVVATTLNFLPKLAQTIFEALNVGNVSDAKDAQDNLKNVLDAIFRHGEWLPAMKATMNLLTPIKVGPVREPLVPIWQDKVNRIKAELQQLKVVPEGYFAIEPSQ